MAERINNRKFLPCFNRTLEELKSGQCPGVPENVAGFNRTLEELKSRSREMGAVSGFEVAEVEWAEVRTVQDHRRTDICRNMHGRRIKVSELVEVRDALIAAENPEDVKNIAPWPKADQLANAPSDKLPSGALMPPYHFNCRTRLMKWREKRGALGIDDVDLPEQGLASAAAAERIGNRLEYAVANQEQLSRREIVRLVDFSKNAHWGSHEIDGKLTVNYHAHKHKKGLGITGSNVITQYNDKMIEIIRNPNRNIYLIQDDRRPQIVYELNKEMVIIDATEQRFQTMMRRRNFSNWIDRQRHIKLNNAKGITKWLNEIAAILKS